MPTRKHTSHGERLIALLLVLAAQSQAQFTNVWPTWEHPRAGKEQAMQVYSGIVERLSVRNQVARDYTCPAPTWYRSQRQNLINFKTAIRILLHGGHGINSYDYMWINPAISNLNEHLTNAAAYRSPFHYIPDTIVMSEAGLCSILRIPTNYLYHTPYRGLDGIGPFTNDTSVGRPHGWTNEYTENGGTNFPDGRSKWYTTDYGWQSMTGILGTLTIAWTPINDDDEQIGWSESSEVYEDYASVVADIEAGWGDQTNAYQHFDGAYWTTYGQNEGPYSASAETAGRNIYADAYCGIECKIDIYADIGVPRRGSTYYTNAYYHQNGSPYANAGCQLVYSGDHYTNEVGFFEEFLIPFAINTNVSLMPISAGPPQEGYDHIIVGWEWYKQWAFSTPDFKYK